MLGGKVCVLYTVGLCPTPNRGINFWDKFTWGGVKCLSGGAFDPPCPPKRNPAPAINANRKTIVMGRQLKINENGETHAINDNRKTIVMGRLLKINENGETPAINGNKKTIVMGRLLKINENGETPQGFF